MNKLKICFFALFFLIQSCSADKKAYKTAALEVCDCMKDKFDLRSKDTLGLEVELKNMYFAKCMLNIEEVNPYDSMMREAIKTNCPQASELYDIYSSMK